MWLWAIFKLRWQGFLCADYRLVVAQHMTTRSQVAKVPVELSPHLQAYSASGFFPQMCVCALWGEQSRRRFGTAFNGAAHVSSGAPQDTGFSATAPLAVPAAGSERRGGL